MTPFLVYLFIFVVIWGTINFFKTPPPPWYTDYESFLLPRKNIVYAFLKKKSIYEEFLTKLDEYCHQYYHCKSVDYEIKLKDWYYILPGFLKEKNLLKEFRDYITEGQKEHRPQSQTYYIYMDINKSLKGWD